MEQKFNNNRLDLQVLREFCEREGEEIAYRKGGQLEREGDPARWFAFVTEGCFKYVKYGMSDDKAHITWFSFESEFVCDYPTFLYGRPSQATIEAMVPSRVLRVTGQQLEQFFNQNKETMKLRAMIGEHILSQFRSRYLDLHCTTPRSQATIEAMVPSRVLRVTGQQLEQFFNQNKETMKLRAMIGEHILSQFRSRYLDLHCTTPRERYEMLLQRCPGIMEFLDLQDIASFLNVHPNTVSKIRRDITFGDR